MNNALLFAQLCERTFGGNPPEINFLNFLMCQFCQYCQFRLHTDKTDNTDMQNFIGFTLLHSFIPSFPHSFIR